MAARITLVHLLAMTRGTSVFLIKSMCIYNLFTEHVCGPRLLSGPSMLPTLNSDLVLEDTWSPRLSPPRIQRGDLVTILSPQVPSKTICKRVIGLPGDTICVYPETAIRVRRPMGEEPERTDGTAAAGHVKPRKIQHVLVPDGHIWISGDNASNSRDSRELGPVPMALVRGRIFARLYPAPRWFKDAVVYID